MIEWFHLHDMVANLSVVHLNVLIVFVVMSAIISVFEVTNAWAFITPCLYHPNMVNPPLVLIN